MPGSPSHQPQQCGEQILKPTIQRQRPRLKCGAVRYSGRKGIGHPPQFLLDGTAAGSLFRNPGLQRLAETGEQGGDLLTSKPRRVGPRKRQQRFQNRLDLLRQGRKARSGIRFFRHQLRQLRQGLLQGAHSDFDGTHGLIHAAEVFQHGVFQRSSRLVCLS